MIQTDKQVENAREFMERMHKELREDYKFRGVRYKDLCWALAVTIGKKLLDEGQSPHLEQIVAPSTRTRQIVPVRFKGNVSWGAHVVCICNQNAWDPVLGSPEPCETYSQKLLGEKLPLQPYKSTADLIKIWIPDYVIDFTNNPSN